MIQFHTSKEELNRLGDSFKTDALSILDDIYNLSYWLTLKKNDTKKIVWITYNKIIHYCDKTKGHADWHNWVHKIFFNRILDYCHEKKELECFNPNLIDSWNPGSGLTSRITEDNIDLISENIIIDILKNIPWTLKLPLTLKDIYNLPRQAIAENLDVPDNVISIRIYRARKLFFKLLVERTFTSELNEIKPDNNKFQIPAEKLRGIVFLIEKVLNENESGTLEKNFEDGLPIDQELSMQRTVRQLLSKSISKRNTPVSLREKIKKTAEKRFFIQI